MDVHREVEFVADDLLVLACEFVGTVDALGVPVCPVQTVFKHCDSKWVWEACNRHPIQGYNQVQQDSGWQGDKGKLFPLPLKPCHSQPAQIHLTLT